MHQGLPARRRVQDPLTVPYAAVWPGAFSVESIGRCDNRSRCAALTCCCDEPLGGALFDTQTFEEGPRPDQIGGSEALCKSVVHGLQ